MRGMLGHAGAGQVDVHAAVGLVRPEQLGLEVRLLLVQTAVVVGVDDAHVALAGVDGLDQRGVVGERIGSQVGDPALDDLLGLLGTVGLDQGGGQRLVVDLLAGAQAQAAFPVLVGQRLIGAQLGRLDPRGGVDDGPRAQRQAGPGAGAGAVLAGDVGVDDLGLQRLEHAFLLGLPEVAGIHGDQQVGRGVLALGLQARQQWRFLVGDELDLDPGLGGVLVEHRLDQLVDARRIDHDLVGGLHGTGQGGQRQGCQDLLVCLHGTRLVRRVELSK
ncbi:hypothetical protein D3C75_830550 [compost metagenome]